MDQEAEKAIIDFREELKRQISTLQFGTIKLDIERGSITGMEVTRKFRTKRNRPEVKV